MRNTLPLLSRTPVSTVDRIPAVSTPPLPAVPTIRLTTATPSTADTPSASGPLKATVLAPKVQAADTRKRLVPKKSKLGLLVGSKRGEKGKDLSDVARCVGMPSASAGRSFDIYVDPADDPDIGEIVVLRKKSRTGLDDVCWGALGDVTNTGKEGQLKMEQEKRAPSPPNPKNEEKEKWWTIGRGRRDSKEKEKENGSGSGKENLKGSIKHTIRQPFKARRSTPPEQIKIVDSRQRSQSFDAGMLLDASTSFTKFVSVPLPDEQVTDQTPRRSQVRNNTSYSLFGPRPNTPTGLVALTHPSEENDRPQNGSIALRAIRSVRSIARISSWAQLKTLTDDVETSAEEKKLEKKEKKKKERTTSMRLSRSSFEVLKGPFGTIRKSSDLTGNVRTVSFLATTVSTPSSNRTECNPSRHSGSSVASSVKTTDSNGSSIEPIIGRQPKISSASSIRWVDQVETVKDKRSPSSRLTSSQTKGSCESKRTAEGRKRPALASLFPSSGPSEQSMDQEQSSREQQMSYLPTLTLEAVGPERCLEVPVTPVNVGSGEIVETPVKRARPRPLSEQMIRRSRPRGIIGDDEGVIQILDAATTDLASLINRLDLEVTPTTTPRGRTLVNAPAVRAQLNSMTNQSPVRKAAKTLPSEKPAEFLEPYAKCPGNASVSASNLLGQQIAPWPTFGSQTGIAHDSKSIPKQGENVPVFQFRQKQLRTPPASPPAPFETIPVFHPLPFSRVRLRPSSRESLVSPKFEPLPSDLASVIASSSQTFGEGSFNMKISTITPTRAGGRHSRGRYGSSFAQLDGGTSLNGSIFMDSDARLALDMRDTLGSLDSVTDDLDLGDSDCDIPGELQRLLFGRTNESMYSAGSERGLLFERPHSPAMFPLPPSPGTPPNMPLPPLQPVEQVWKPEPVFHARMIDDGDELDDVEVDDVDNETKKSFDFTAEIKRLNESGLSNRRSFVMQLEDAFKTPARFALGLGNGDDIPEVPVIPAMYLPVTKSAHDAPASPVKSEPASEDSFSDSVMSEAQGMDASLDEDICVKQPSQPRLHTAISKPSIGQLNMNFKFGGKPPQVEVAPVVFSGKPLSLSDIIPPPSYHSRNHSYSSVSSFEKPLSLSDIIPPPSHHSRRQSFSSVTAGESCVLKSIFAKATELSELSSPNTIATAARFGAGSKGDARLEALTQLTAHSRENSEVSFSGLSSFSEIRRGFEYGASRRAFYPLQCLAQNSLQVSQAPNPSWRESLLSLPSVSSYGHVLHPGSNDPFDYGVPARPISEDMSYTVDDTFSFLRHDARRQRVDSDASNYSFHAPNLNLLHVQQRRNRRQVDSMISVASGPPVSLYNRGFSYYGHRHSDSNNNTNSFMHEYGAIGANSDRVSRHHRTFSTDSVASEFSAYRLERPGIGDKMFESARDKGMPLSAISASPSDLESSRGWQTTFDSTADEKQDSLFDGTGRRSLSTTSENVFDIDNCCSAPQGRPELLPPNQFRPLSMYSMNSTHSPKREDDTMISMLGGGHVRRRSIGSTFEGSPCVRAEKRRHKGYVGRVLTRIPSDDGYDYFADQSVDKARIIEPSFATTYDGSLEEVKVDPPSTEESPSKARISNYEFHFGGNRMSLARKGLLERQSLEECCLSAEGEDTSTTGPTLGVFNRPDPVARDQSTETNSGTDTPPLSLSETSSQTSGSQCSIDLGRLNTLLSNTINPGLGPERARARARGQGHRRRISEARASRTSIYETIEEEASGNFEVSSLTDKNLESSIGSTIGTQLHDLSVLDIKDVRWDNEDVGPALSKYYALQNEARKIVDASQRAWEDTPFSLYAVQSFDPPRRLVEIQALLEHSRKAYGPLPSELRCPRRRTRTLSRPSPYPRDRIFTQTSNEHRPLMAANMSNVICATSIPRPLKAVPLKEVSINANISANSRSPTPALNPFKPFTPFSIEFKDKGQLAPTVKGSPNLVLPIPGVRPRDSSRACMTASGGSKRAARKSPRKFKANKENAVQGVLTRPTESLRIVRPRPRGRPVPPTSHAIRI